jgi:adenylylsulfate kinase
MQPRSSNITWHGGHLSQDEREKITGQRGAVVWFTGLSGSGKSTLARLLELRLLQLDRFAYVLDGDNLRHGLNADLDFSPENRRENIRRVGAVAQIMEDAGVLCLTAFISPYREDRSRARARITPGRFIEVHVATSVAACEARDPKGLYQKARDGLISNFTGISAPYEAPIDPELVVHTEGRTPEECVQDIVDHLRSRGLLPTQPAQA